MVTNGDKWWQMVTNGDKWWQTVTNGDKLWQMVTNGDKQWQMVTNSDKWWQTITNTLAYYTGLIKVTKSNKHTSLKWFDILNVLDQGFITIKLFTALILYCTKLVGLSVQSLGL